MLQSHSKKGTTYLQFYQKDTSDALLATVQFFFEFLENFGAGSVHRVFRLCAIIAIYAFTFIFLTLLVHESLPLIPAWVESTENNPVLKKFK